MPQLKYLTAICFSILLASTASADKLSLEAIHGETNLSGASPRNVQLSPDGQHVGFLRGKTDNQYQLDLWEYNVQDHQTRMLLDSRLFKTDGEISDVEKARRERMRKAGLQGVLDYQWSPNGKQILVPLASGLYIVDVAHTDKVRKIAEGDISDPKISPRGKYVSFIRKQNLYVVDLLTGSERALTTDGAGTLHNGEAEFVAQEEMGQFSGYWWAPDDSAIAFKHFDEAPVTLAKRFEIYADRTDVIEQRYPAAGEANVKVGLSVVDPANGSIRAVDLGANPDIYLVRADWANDAKRLYFMRQARDQKSLDLIAVDMATLTQKPILQETSSTWVNVHTGPHFLKDQSAFVWTSERSGSQRLYLFDLDGKLLHPISTGTEGGDEFLAVNEKQGLVYFLSNRNAIIDHQVFSVRLDGSNSNQPRRISSENGWHDARFAANASIYVDTWSDTDTPPQVSLRDAQGKFLTWIEHNELALGHPYFKYRDAHVKTEFGTMTAEDGQVLHYSVKRPIEAGAAVRHPVLLQVYGGPGAQTVQNRWSGLFDQYLAQRGYVVFRLDNRGSANRERKFTDVIYGDLGKNEVADQVRGIDWLRQQPYVDPSRIAVFGWSYGGFMSLRLLEAASDRLAAGVAVAPVTDWHLYDTHYTEQYLGHPEKNASGYQDSSVFSHLEGLHSPLLLVHGMADDNVLFTNSTRLMDALTSRGILYELMTYPGAKHGISGPRSQLHVFRTIEKFLQERLEKPGNAK